MPRSQLLAGFGIIALHLKYSVLDYDIWWHLKVGDWIIDNLSLPRTGILSRTAADRPWVAYSWGYEILLSRAYAWFGLMGIGLYGVLLTIGLAAAIYWMLSRPAPAVSLARQHERRRQRHREHQQKNQIRRPMAAIHLFNVNLPFPRVSVTEINHLLHFFIRKLRSRFP